MANDNSSDTRVLGSHVHARLFNRHTLQAKPHINRAERANAEQNVVSARKSVFCLDLDGTLPAKKLVFTRVRMIGSIIKLESVTMDDAAHELIYVDDGTGVVPFMLRTQFSNEDEELAIEENNQRLLAARDTHQTLVGITVEVLGSLRYSQYAHVPATDSEPILPSVWIECSHLSIKDDAMAETAAVFDILATYKFYFPRPASNGSAQAK
ncbi:hypothetical protein H4S02_013098 [Coemansia sp. RSA 2611]|nr:hypothetical protein H4S02_013098 [Coemansia sp. RSA 2611]